MYSEESWCERCRANTMFDDSDVWYQVSYMEYIISRCPVCKGMYYHDWNDLSLVNTPVKGETHSFWQLLIGKIQAKIRREMIACIYLVTG